jgi:cytochrome c oxidase subunit 3
MAKVECVSKKLVKEAVVCKYVHRKKLRKNQKRFTLNGMGPSYELLVKEMFVIKHDDEIELLVIGLMPKNDLKLQEMMATVGEQQRKRLHPHKFALWVGMASILMMFAGFTSAYIVKRNDSNWLEFRLPPIFWFSTAVILLSSLTIHLATKSFKARNMARYRTLITATAALGVLFVILQWTGFQYLQDHGVKLIGSNSNASGSFLGVITGVHMLHVLGGVVVLLVMFLKAFSSRKRNYSSVPIEVAGTYWHFVDGIWIYLFVFFNVVSG